MKKLNIAITGSNGYIGSFLRNYLKAQGHTIYEMGRKAADSSNHFIFFELGKSNDYSRLCDVDVLIHCAYDFSALDYQQIKNINYYGSLDLFEQAKKQGVKKIIYLSSTSAFAGAVSHYGRIKYEIELAVQAMGVISVRPGLVFNKQAGGIIRAIKKLVNKIKCIPIIGNGRQIFFPCHVEDLSALIAYLIEHEVALQSQPIIAASEKTITFAELIKTLAHSQHKNVVLIPVPYAWIFFGLRLAELLKLRLGLRSDSLKYMKYYNKHPDFLSLHSTGIKFRPLTVETLQM